MFYSPRAQMEHTYFKASFPSLTVDQNGSHFFCASRAEASLGKRGCSVCGDPPNKSTAANAVSTWFTVPWALAARLSS